MDKIFIRINNFYQSFMMNLIKAYVIDSFYSKNIEKNIYIKKYSIK